MPAVRVKATAEQRLERDLWEAEMVLIGHVFDPHRCALCGSALAFLLRGSVPFLGVKQTIAPHHVLLKTCCVACEQHDEHTHGCEYCP